MEFLAVSRFTDEDREYVEQSEALKETSFYDVQTKSKTQITFY
jgi:hypothetical protein